MSKGPIVLMDHTYPFGALTGSPSTQKHLVKKKMPRGDEQLERAKILESLKHDTLIRLQNLQEEGNECWLFFQYIPQSIDKWSASVNRQFIENYQQRLILFSRYLADKGIIVVFKRENMGVNLEGDAKYFVDTNFEMDANIDKLALKKKYKEEIKQLLQLYLDKKSPVKTAATTKQPAEKKQSSKLFKIMEAIEKGKANLCTQPKEVSTALVAQQKSVSDGKYCTKSIKNIQNVTIQKQVNKINKIQLVVNNKPIDLLQQELKKQYTSSSMFINGIPTAKIQKRGESRRLFSPNDKLTKFQEIKFKEYKNIKASGQVYVQDFLNVLQFDNSQKFGLHGSPRSTFNGSPSTSALRGSPRNTMVPLPRATIEPNKPKQIESREKRQKQQQNEEVLSKMSSSAPDVEMMPLSGRIVHTSPSSNLAIKHSCLLMGTNSMNKTVDLQKKVSEAIANSLSAISKFKRIKNETTV